MSTNSRNNTEYFDFIVPEAGVYEVLLTVTDNDALQRLDKGVAPLASGNRP